MYECGFCFFFRNGLKTKAVNDLLGYMAFGVLSKWNNMVKSNKRTTDGKMIVNNTDMHAIKFVFVFPLTAGSFVRQNKVIIIHLFLTSAPLPYCFELRSQPLTLTHQFTDYVDSSFTKDLAGL